MKKFLTLPKNDFDFLGLLFSFSCAGGNCDDFLILESIFDFASIILIHKFLSRIGISSFIILQLLLILVSRAFNSFWSLIILIFCIFCSKLLIIFFSILAFKLAAASFSANFNAVLALFSKTFASAFFKTSISFSISLFFA